MAGKIAVWLGKVIGAGVTALALLSLFCAWYYNPPVHTEAANGATGYTRQADVFWARATEGFASGHTDENGYNNSYPAEDTEEIHILMMGSSQTEGLYVSDDECASYLLNRYFEEDGSGRYVYNIGMSAHEIFRNVSNLDTALSVYEPTEYVAIETGSLSYQPEEVWQALSHDMPALTVGSGHMLLDLLQGNPYLKLVYQQYSNYKNRENEDTGVGRGYDVFSDETLEADRQLLGYIAATARAHQCEPILYYIPQMQLEDDGELAFAATEDTREQYDRLCREQGILFVDMTDRMEELYEQEHILASGFANTQVGYGHLNREGHRILADAIYEAILEREGRL